MDPALLSAFVNEGIPFNKFLGIRATRIEEGRARLEIPFREELIGDALRPAIHGGVISALADTAGGVAVWSAVEGLVHRVSTIDLRVDYLRPGRAEALIADASIVRVGRSVGVADIRLFHPSAEGESVATGKGVYAIKVPKQPRG